MGHIHCSACGKSMRERRAIPVSRFPGALTCPSCHRNGWPRQAEMRMAWAAGRFDYSPWDGPDYTKKPANDSPPKPRPPNEVNIFDPNTGRFAP